MQSSMRLNRVFARRIVATTFRPFSPRTLSSGGSGGFNGEGSVSDRVGLPEEATDQRDKDGMTSNIGHYDVAIVGGGMVGMALACALSSMPLTKNLTIAIIDSNPALGSKGIFKQDGVPDPRVSTVTPATISFFQEIGAWKYVQQHRHAYFDKMQVWDYTGLGFTKYCAKEVDKDILGCVVENKVLHRSLFASFQDTDIQKTIYPARLTSMAFESPDSSTVADSQPPNEQGISSGSAYPRDTSRKQHHECLAKLDLDDGSSLFAKLVVGADGAKSCVRETAGLKTTGWSYPQSAIICTVEHNVENSCAWQRFLPSGPIALLPMGDRYSNIVWTMSPNESTDHKLMSEDDFVRAVNHALDYGYGPHPQSTFLGLPSDRFTWITGWGASSVSEYFEVPPKVVKVASERMAFPLSLMHAHNYASRRVVLMGDAAHTVHPLAGQGVNLGFGDASSLSKVIAEGIMTGRDIGELSLLKKYEKDRMTANIAMMALIDGFQKAFSVDVGPINLLRAAAFHGAQYIKPLKRNIISYAMGEQKWPLFS
ncbi:hypothetical protein QJS10_CPA08g01157 [Acorus calamus]|uniref:Ubiquinone biosynthesis monooxygenase COQ6, mitochondrial n=1 Tax=Acorus calamus TaxID=4465 RepID=A0AAV9E8F6_ACOCL|nr:hypothetical protein QJS10_CPA08g01157 [Acorus calamus]